MLQLQAGQIVDARNCHFRETEKEEEYIITHTEVSPSRLTASLHPLVNHDSCIAEAGMNRVTGELKHVKYLAINQIELQEIELICSLNGILLTVSKYLLYASGYIMGAPDGETEMIRSFCFDQSD